MRISIKTNNLTIRKNDTHTMEQPVKHLTHIIFVNWFRLWPILVVFREECRGEATKHAHDREPDHPQNETRRFGIRHLLCFIVTVVL